MPLPRTLCVAGVQVESRDGEVEANLARAEPLVAEAAARGAQLVLCPELLAAGYVYHESIWESGEPRDGATESWLRRLAAVHRVFLGASYLEAEGEDFYNTFTLATPDGAVAGRVRKEALPGFEGWYCRSGDGSKIIDTELGRIAVGICHDSHTARFLRRIAGEAPDLLLMPHSAPCGLVPASHMRESLCEIAPFYARALGIPAILVNKARASSHSPIPGIPWLRVRFTFPGLSTIVDSDARVVAHLSDRPNLAIADVTLDAARKHDLTRFPSGYWSRRPSRFPRLSGALFEIFERLGKRAYVRSRARPIAARAASSRHVSPDAGFGLRGAPPTQVDRRRTGTADRKVDGGPAIRERRPSRRPRWPR
jgi:N-carbamoylputrescine amidase